MTTPERRPKMRAEHSEPVLKCITGLMTRPPHLVTPGGLRDKARRYRARPRPKLTRHMGNGGGRVDIDPCESAIRSSEARRSGLFADTVEGAKARANLNPLIEACKMNGVEPYRCLVTLCRALPLTTIADNYEGLVPWLLDLA